MRPIIVWFRRDLRVDDHAALWHATRTGAPIVPLFIFDTSIIRSLSSDGAAFDFQADALRELADKLTRLGGNLLLRHGTATQVHRELIREFHPSALYYNQDYEPSAQKRDADVERLYRASGIDVVAFKDLLLLEPAEVLTNEGKPYSVFTPFSKKWLSLPVSAPYGTPRKIHTPSMNKCVVLDAAALHRSVTITNPFATGGESHARKRWKKFLTRAVGQYESLRDVLSVDGTSRMSPFLRFGMISVRRMYEDLIQLQATNASTTASIAKYINELIWREFYASVLWHFPHIVDASYRSEFDRMPWSTNEHHFEAWAEGRTGVPLVDAGMRQLNQTGWMHNRVRMVVASYLTKHLRIDWRKGAEYFATKLLDHETASNNGGWQWSASTGVDPKPLRIFNPRLQAERFDPDGLYIRAYVPELNEVPARYIHAPHEMPPLVAHEVRCLVGKDYPRPLVDHTRAVAAYKSLYYRIARATKSKREGVLV
jgi:deoxyribodipyrimidine photo-lyase